MANYNCLFRKPDYSIDGQITDNTLQFYGQYGISDKTTFLLNLPLKSISYQQNVQCLVASNIKFVTGLFYSEPPRKVSIEDFFQYDFQKLVQINKRTLSKPDF